MKCPVCQAVLDYKWVRRVTPATEREARECPDLDCTVGLVEVTVDR